MLTKQLAPSPTITEQGEPSNTFILPALHQQNPSNSTGFLNVRASDWIRTSDQEFINS